MPGIPKCRLATYKPTPTTIRFTVTTRSPIDTLPKKTIYYSLFLARFTTILCLLALLITKISLRFGTPRTWSELPAVLQRTAAQQHIVAFIRDGMRTRVVIPLCVGAIYILLQRNYKEESILVLRGLGVQTTSSAKNYLTKAETRFIPTTSIQDIFIHEAFIGFEVRFYLSIVVEGEEDVVVVYPALLPGLKVLEVVWRGVRGGLWEEAKS